MCDEKPEKCTTPAAPSRLKRHVCVQSSAMSSGLEAALDDAASALVHSTLAEVLQEGVFAPQAEAAPTEVRCNARSRCMR